MLEKCTHIAGEHGTNEGGGTVVMGLANEMISLLHPSEQKLND